MKRRLSKNCSQLLNLHIVVDVKNIVRTFWTIVQAGTFNVALRESVNWHCDRVFVHLWRSGNKTELFSDLAAFPVLQERKEQIQDVISEIQNHRKEIRLTLKVPAFDYTTVSGQEVPSLSVSLKEVGGDWWSSLGRRGDLWCLCACLINGDMFLCPSALGLFIKVVPVFLLHPAVSDWGEELAVVHCSTWVGQSQQVTCTLLSGLIIIFYFIFGLKLCLLNLLIGYL